MQTVGWAIRPPCGRAAEGELYWELWACAGCIIPAAVLDEIAREILYFSAADGTDARVGMDLKVNLLAGEGKGAGA